MYVPTLQVHLNKYKISLWYGMDIFWNHPINNQNNRIDPTDQLSIITIQTGILMASTI